MRLYSYIVARDYGFAPNPFHGYCTLATCKPRIRAKAMVGDWIVGTGAKTKYNLAGHLIYAMKVTEILNYDAYWNDPRFLCKRPVLNGSLKLIYGDNIYHQNGHQWVQTNSHHSLKSGEPNPRNIARDTTADRLLVSTEFIYWGCAAPPIPNLFRSFRKTSAATSEDICCRRQGHKVRSEELAVALEQWVASTGRWGIQGLPLEFGAHQRAGRVLTTESRSQGRPGDKIRDPRVANRRSTS